MLEFQFQKCTRRCHESGREFNSGEEFYSVLIAVGGEVVRRDFSCEHWTEPPGDAIGWWKSEMPEQTSKTANLAPNDVLIQFFTQLSEQPEKADLRYILGLLLVRKRLLRLEGTQVNTDGNEELVLTDPKQEAEHLAVVIDPTTQRAEAIQRELTDLLYKDAA